MKPLYFLVQSGSKIDVYPFSTSDDLLNFDHLFQAIHHTQPVHSECYNRNFKETVFSLSKKYNLFFDSTFFQLEYPNEIAEFACSKEFWLYSKSDKVARCISYYNFERDEMIRIIYESDRKRYHVFHHRCENNRKDLYFSNESDAHGYAMKWLRRKMYKDLLSYG